MFILLGNNIDIKARWIIIYKLLISLNSVFIPSPGTNDKINPTIIKSCKPFASVFYVLKNNLIEGEFSICLVIFFEIVHEDWWRLLPKSFE